MKKHFIKYLLLLLLPTAIVGCKDDDATYDAPYIEATETSIAAHYNDASVSFDITSNREWEITTYSNSESEAWFAVNPTSGKGNKTVTVDLITNPGNLRTLVLKIATSTLSEYVTIKQAGESGVTEFVTLFEENMGTTDVSGNTAIAEWASGTYPAGFQRGGEGGSEATYTGEGSYMPTVRKSGANSNGSGSNNIWLPYGEGNYFVVDNIKTNGEKAAKLSFNRLSNLSTGDTDGWTSDNVNDNYLQVYIIRDGVLGEKLSYTTNNDYTTSSAWCFVTTEAFDISSATTFGFRFATTHSSIGSRIDDLTVETTDETPTPPEPLPAITGTTATSIGDNSATITGSYTYTGTATITEVGVAYKASTGSAYITVPMSSVPTDGNVSVAINGLSAGTEYTCYIYVTNTNGTYKGEELTFTTTGTAVITTTTAFSDNFDAVTANNLIYESDDWAFTSTDTNWPSTVHYGWKTGMYNSDKYIQIAPYSSSLSEVTAYAVMTTFDMAAVSAANRKLSFSYAFYYQTEDNSKFEVVASTNYTGSVENAAWTVVKDVTLTSTAGNAINTWLNKEIDLSAYTGNTTVAFRYTGKSVTYRLDDVKFNAGSSITAPTVTTGSAANVAETTATLAGTFTAGSETITEVGIAYKVSSASSYTEAALATVPTDGNISVDITGLTAATSYSFYAYVTTASGTVKGNDVTFTTTGGGSGTATNFSAIWNMAGSTGWGETPKAPSTITPENGAVSYGNLTMHNIYTGTGTAAGNTFGGTGWDANTDPANPERYAYFTITSTAKTSLKEIKASLRITKTGPIKTSLQYSLDGTTYTQITVFEEERPSATTSYGYTYDLSGVANLQNVAANSTITFRFVPYEATNTAGAWYITNNKPVTGYENENLVISGTYTE